MAPEEEAGPNPVRFIVYSDYLCPWCFNASVRLHRLEEENPGRVELVWRSYLLRPEPRAADPRGEALEKFRDYTRSWLRPAAEADSGEFRGASLTQHPRASGGQGGGQDRLPGVSPAPSAAAARLFR